MMSGTPISYEKAINYFERSKEYYTKNLTNDDKWHGKLGKRLGLKGELSKEQFDLLGKELLERGRKKRIGFDATFSAPKSVSLAMAESEEAKEKIIEIHQRAVQTLIEKIETRKDYKRIKTQNMVCGEFVHFLNRNEELDLHSHCIIFNMTECEEKTMTIDYKNLLDEKKQLGLEYRRELAAGLQEAGYKLKLTDERQGFFEIEGFDRETVMEYSSRRREILKEAEKQGTTTGKGKQLANLGTRKSKDENSNLSSILEEVRTELYESGKIKIERAGVNERARDSSIGKPCRAEDNERIPGQRYNTNLKGVEGQKYRVFAERNSVPKLPSKYVDKRKNSIGMLLPASAVSRMAKYQTEGVRSADMQWAERAERRQRVKETVVRVINKLSSEKYAFTEAECKQRIMAAGLLDNVKEKEAEKLMEKLKLVRLGRIKGDYKNEYLTTEENINREKSIVERMRKGKGQINSLRMEESEERLKKIREEKGLKPNEEQMAVIHHIMTSADRYVCLQGLAGTGKTYTMKTLKEMCEGSGIEIKGLSFTGKAAAGLEEESGIKSETIHGFLNKLEKESGVEVEKVEGIKQEWDFSKVQAVKNREIWVVDEAGLVDNHLMEQLQKAAEARQVQVVLSGDYDQMPAIGAGEPLRLIIEQGAGTAYLEDIRRQKDMELLEAVIESVKGDHLKTYEILERRGDYQEIKEKVERQSRIKEEMTILSLEEYRKNLLLVTTNADRKAYNEKIRAEYVRRGELEQGEKYRIKVQRGEKESEESRNFAAGDRIIFTANDKRLGVKNGMMGRIGKIEGKNFEIKLDEGKQIRFNIEEYGHIEHSYAVTNYKAQGMTVEKVVVEMNTESVLQNRNALYVDISRAKTRAIVYTDNKAKLEHQTRNFAHKVTSRDFAKRLRQMESRGRIENNERYHAPQPIDSFILLEEIKQLGKWIFEKIGKVVEVENRNSPESVSEAREGVLNVSNDKSIVEKKKNAVRGRNEGNKRNIFSR